MALQRLLFVTATALLAFSSSFVVYGQTIHEYFVCENSASSSYQEKYINSTTEDFLITSSNLNFGNFGQFDSNHDCYFVLKTQTEPLVVSFRIEYFVIEQHVFCSNDFLCLNGVRLCGAREQNYTFQFIVPEQNSFTVFLKTDNGGPRGGFQIQVSLHLAGSDVIQEARGEYGSTIYNTQLVPVQYYPGYPYTDRCSASQFNNAGNDFSENPTTAPPQFNGGSTSSGNQNYELCTSNWTVYMNPSSPAVFVTSPNFGYGSYSDSLRCSGVIRSEAQPLTLAFSYIAFDLEMEPFCGWDYICVDGVRFCGNWLTGHTFHYILPPYSDLTISLKTDGSVVASGFQLRITPEFAGNQSIQKIIGGLGSSEQTLNFTSTTYHNGYPYIDKCGGDLPISTTPIFTDSFTRPETTTTDLFTTTRTNEITTPEYSYSRYYFCNSGQSSAISISPYSAPTIIRSPGYGNGTNYQNNINCNLVFTTNYEPVALTLYYRSFNVEACTCSCDYLCVNGVKYCSSWLGGYTFQYLIPRFSSFTLKFITDISVINTGLEVLASFAAPSSQMIREAYAGIGTSYNNVLFRNVSFPLPYQYIDRCAADPPPTPWPWMTTPSASPCQANANEIIEEVRRAELSLARIRALLHYNGLN